LQETAANFSQHLYIWMPSPLFKSVITKSPNVPV